jgi:hypothetical protein
MRTKSEGVRALVKGLVSSQRVVGDLAHEGRGACHFRGQEVGGEEGELILLARSTWGVRWRFAIAANKLLLIGVTPPSTVIPPSKAVPPSKSFAIINVRSLKERVGCGCGLDGLVDFGGTYCGAIHEEGPLRKAAGGLALPALLDELGLCFLKLGPLSRVAADVVLQGVHHEAQVCREPFPRLWFHRLAYPVVDRLGSLGENVGVRTAVVERVHERCVIRDDHLARGRGCFLVPLLPGRR